MYTLSITYHCYTIDDSLSSPLKLLDNSYETSGIAELKQTCSTVGGCIYDRYQAECTFVRQDLDFTLSCPAFDGDILICLDPSPAPFRSDDIVRKYMTKGIKNDRKWWIHHIDVNEEEFSNKFDAKAYVECLIENDFKLPEGLNADYFRTAEEQLREHGSCS